MIYLISSVYVHSLADLLEADFGVASAAGVAKVVKARTQIERIVLLQKAGVNLLLLGNER